MKQNSLVKRPRSRFGIVRTKSAYTKPTLTDGYEGKPRTVNFQQNYEKYQSLARESLSMGDRILAESYYQHAEHYLRMIKEFRPIPAEPLAHDLAPALEEVQDCTEENGETSESSTEQLNFQKKSHDLGDINVVELQ